MQMYFQQKIKDNLMFCVQNFSVDVAIGGRMLSTDLVAGLLNVSGVLSQPGSVHQVEQVAIVRSVVEKRQGLGNAVGLKTNCIRSVKERFCSVL